MLVQQVPYVLPSLGADVVLAGLEHQAKNRVFSRHKVTNKAKIATSQEELQMRDWRKTFKKPGLSGMRELPDNLHCSVPRSV